MYRYLKIFNTDQVLFRNNNNNIKSRLYFITIDKEPITFSESISLEKLFFTNVPLLLSDYY